jgi:hypothetical protein
MLGSRGVLPVEDRAGGGGDMRGGGDVGEGEGEGPAWAAAAAAVGCESERRE